MPLELNELNVFTGSNVTRKFRFEPGSVSAYQSWTTLSQSKQLGRFITRIHRDGTSADCVRGQGPYIAFQLTGIGNVATTGVANLDKFICSELGHWRELEQLIGKIHIANGGSWHANPDSRAITVSGACLAFTHRKKSFEPSVYKLERPRPWGLEMIALTEGRIVLVP